MTLRQSGCGRIRRRGWWGGLIAGIAIFAPSVALTMIVGEVYSAFRHLRRVRGAMAGILAGFTGLLASLVLTLGRSLSPAPAALVLAGAAFVAMRLLRWRLGTAAVFAGELAIWGVYLAAGGRSRSRRPPPQPRETPHAALLPGPGSR